MLSDRQMHLPCKKIKTLQMARLPSGPSSNSGQLRSFELNSTTSTITLMYIFYRCFLKHFIFRKYSMFCVHVYLHT